MWSPSFLSTSHSCCFPGCPFSFLLSGFYSSSACPFRHKVEQIDWGQLANWVRATQRYFSSNPRCFWSSENFKTEYIIIARHEYPFGQVSTGSFWPGSAYLGSVRWHCIWPQGSYHCAPSLILVPSGLSRDHRSDVEHNRALFGWELFTKTNIIHILKLKCLGKCDMGDQKAAIFAIVHGQGNSKRAQQIDRTREKVFLVSQLFCLLFPFFGIENNGNTHFSLHIAIQCC